ncbi:MBL fold metallo-hydrolase [Streptomyces sp. NPDC088725]|uniref:MBL fold metallo-hydrolase n=1 Tax=Streptomyces sp. NPDC088725 TaxID=3365873 RepID=UPI00380D8D6E
MAKPQPRQVSAHAWAWVDESGLWGHANSGLITQGSDALLVNTLHDRRETESMLASIGASLPDVRIDRVLLTDSSPHNYWGLGALEGIEPIVSYRAAAKMAGRISPAETAAIIDSAAPGTPLNRYLHKLFGDFDFADGERFTPAGSFSGRSGLQVGTEKIELIEFGSAQAESNTVVWLPEDSVLFTGDLLSPGIHPAVWSGSLTGWHAACAQLIDLRPQIVVPGHGPVTDTAGLADFRDYLYHLIDQIRLRFEKGMPAEEAAVDVPLDQWEHWGHRENLAVTVGAVYRELAAENSTSYSAVMTLAAEIDSGRRRRPRIHPQDSDRFDATPAGEAYAKTASQSLNGLLADRPAPNVIRTIANHPGLLTAIQPLIAHVAGDDLGARERELVILRTAWRSQAQYIWAHHHSAGLFVGLSETEIARVASEDTSEWTPFERALVVAVDELHTDSVLSEGTWKQLAERYGKEQLLELLALTGTYKTLALILNSSFTPFDSWMEDPAILPDAPRRG